jgi:tripartite-type tricarboxylate transporter receptor subunit TctC
MKLPRRKFLHLAAGAAALCVLSVSVLGHVAWSQTARTIKIVVPVPPGGSADILARLLSEQVGRTHGLTMVIENRPGAAAVIGTEVVSRAVPDGSTVLIAQTPFVINSHLRKLPYDPLTSFEPICNLATTPTVIVVNSASPYRTLGDLLSAARSKAGELTAASLTASPGHLTFEMLKRAANVDMTFVPYPGQAPAISALLGGHVTAIFTPYPGVEEQLKAGKLRALAVPLRTRIAALPEVPTLAESGYDIPDGDLWTGLLAPARTPKETVTQLAGWFTAALQAPEIKSKLMVQGFFPVEMCGADFATYLRKQYDDYGRIIREANIKAE